MKIVNLIQLHSFIQEIHQGLLIMSKLKIFNQIEKIFINKKQ